MEDWFTNQCYVLNEGNDTKGCQLYVSDSFRSLTEYGKYVEYVHSHVGFFDSNKLGVWQDAQARPVGV